MNTPFIIVGSTFVALLSYRFMVAGGSIVESLAISIWIYGKISLFYASCLVYVKARRLGLVETDSDEDCELDFSTQVAWLDSINILNIFGPIVVR